MLGLESLAEITVYGRDMKAALHFYRDLLGMPVGLNYFAHTHLDAGNMSLVLRTTWRRCDHEGPYGCRLILQCDDLVGLRRRLAAAGIVWQDMTPDAVLCRDPDDNEVLVWGAAPAVADFPSDESRKDS